ncbi:MAG: membrane protein [Minwuia thermotolerans]|nr:MAG: membrane protein [Minwuia thermotolerans]
MNQPKVKTLAPLPIAMLVAAALVYGLVFPFNQLASEAGGTFFGHAFWQVFLAGIALFVIANLQGQRVRFGWVWFRAYVVVGAFGFGLPMALLTFVGPNLPTAIVSLVLALSPTCTYLASILFRIDRLSAFGIVGILLGFAGVAVVLAPDSAMPGTDAVTWFLLALIVPVFLAIANISAALLRPPEVTSTVMGAGFLLGAALSLLPLMLLFNQTYLPLEAAILIPTLGSAAVNAVFIILFAELVRRWGPTFFAQFNYLAVVAAIGWAAIFFGEQPGIHSLIALALMATGVMISELRHRKG